MKSLSYIAMILFLSACVSTRVKDFTDPDYISFISKRLVIESPSQTFTDYFADALRRIDVEYISSDKLFLPTRSYTKDERLKTMEKKGFDSVLLVDFSGGSRSSSVVAYNTSTRIYGGGYGNTYASSSTIPISTHRRNSQARAKLYNIKTGRIIWVGNLHTSASGALYMSNSSTVKSMTKSIVASLLRKGHLIKKK